MTLGLPRIETVLAFLRRPKAHPERPTTITVRETHFAWVFIGDRVVRKMKKPVRAPHLDFRTLAAREVACREELRANRVLAPDVYVDVEPLTVSADGRLAIGGEGKIVDWLVRMRRLPELRTLERSARVEPRELDALADALALFYQGAPVARLGPAERLARIDAALAEFEAPLAALGAHGRVATALRRFVGNHPDLIGRRVGEGRVVDGHGDLRPEHVYLTHPPRLLDRLEFEPELRCVDWLEDVALLAVDLAELRRSWIADHLVRALSRRLDDPFPAALRDVYGCWRGCLRASLCLAHRDRPGRQGAGEWTRRARQYLAIAQGHLRRLDGR